MSRRLPVTSSERSRLHPFVIATGDATPRDQRDLMERPFFSLAKAKRTTPILYEAATSRWRSSPCPSTAWRPSGTPTC